MALLLAMLRTLVDERLEPARLIARLNVQVCRHAPASRFITLFYGVYRSGDRRADLRERRPHAAAAAARATARRAARRRRRRAGHVRAVDLHRWPCDDLSPDDLLAIYSDGITEAENPAGVPFDEAGLEAVLARQPPSSLIRRSAPRRARGRDSTPTTRRFADDLTILLLRRCVTYRCRRPSVSKMTVSAQDLWACGQSGSCSCVGRRLRCSARRARVATRDLDGIARAARASNASCRPATPTAYLALLADSADRARAQRFRSAGARAGATRTVDRRNATATARAARCRQRLPADGRRLRRVRQPARDRDLAARRQAHRRGRRRSRVAIADEERLSSVENLYRLSLDPTKQFAARRSEDRRRGSRPDAPRRHRSFVADVDQGVTGLVLLGQGDDARSIPSRRPRRGRSRSSAAATRSRRAFDAVFIRMNPATSTTLVNAVEPDAARRSTRASCSARRTSFARSRRSRSSSTSAI